ncbi:MAG: long-chain fatty acid--CoA ligase [Desulfobacteraceae bacterium]
MYTYEKPVNLVEMLETSVVRHGRRPLFGIPDASGDYAWQTYGEIGNRIDDLRAGLARLGVGAGDAVGIIANNRAEWAIAAFATFGLLGRFIPMYEKELPEVWEHIIRDAHIKVLFVANENILLRVQQFRKDANSLEHLLLIEGSTAPNMANVEKDGQRHPISASHPDPTDIAVLIYTSGTTGHPKGVLLSHGNLTSNFIAGGKMFPDLNHESRSLSILPWAHAYGQTAELYNFMNLGASIGFIRDISTIGEDMVKVAPTFLIAVPRVFNKIYDDLHTKMKQTGGLAHKLFTMGIDSAARLRELSAQGKTGAMQRMKYKLADTVVFKKIRYRFGGRLTGALTASAMMSPEVAQFFVDIGLPVFDAYGLTETSPAVTMNSRTVNKSGSVGRPIEHVRVVIDPKVSVDARDEGEVVVYGPNVMQGYHNNPEATQAVMTADGGFRTGDIGRLDEDGFLYITGRIKEQYKLENGKYVYPASIEEAVQLSPWVENALVYGEGRRHNICLVVPNFLKLSAWAIGSGMGDPTPEELIVLPQVRTMIESSIAQNLASKFGNYEIPKKIILVAEPFSVDNGLLTQTLKLKRLKVLERYAKQIDEAYEQAG